MEKNPIQTDYLNSLYLCTLWKHDEKVSSIIDRYFHTREIYTIEDLLSIQDQSIFKGTNARADEKKVFCKSLKSIGIYTKDNNFIDRRTH